jgi:lipoprotein-anchoring transpeptidase ErfK/SrfK
MDWQNSIWQVGQATMRNFLGMFVIGAFLFVISGAFSPVLAQDECGAEVIVARGDSLSKIARRCGTTLSALLEANPDIKTPDRIKVGQRVALEKPAPAGPSLNIAPASASPGAEIEIQVQGYPAKTSVRFLMAPETDSGEPEYELIQTLRTDADGSAAVRATLPETAAETGAWMVMAELRKQAGQGEALVKRLPLTSLSEVVHIVQRGDRLSRIASRYNTNVTSIMKKNEDILNPHRIFVGQVIAIPGPDEQYPDEEFLPVAANPRLDVESIVGVKVAEDERWIDVDLTSQTVHVYEGKELVRSFLASTGRARTPTVTGQYRIYVKFTATDMRGPGYHLKDVPYTMYFHKGYGLHGTYWHNNFGTPMSNGCVNLRTEDAQWLFNFASVGTLVNVHH